MRPGVIIALTASLALVGWATWYRHVSSLGSDYALTAVTKEKVSQDYYDELTSKFLDSATSTPDAPESLTTTDLIGRQIVSDYLNLAQSGQVTDQNLSDLVESYVSSIPDLADSPQKSLIDLKVVGNSPANFSTYGSQVESVYRNYATKLLNIYPDGAITMGTQTVAASKAMGIIYADTAKKLQALAVPAELSTLHLMLINVYLSNAAAMHALAGFDNDPASSFAGLLMYKTNTEKEAEILSKIEETLTEHGI